MLESDGPSPRDGSVLHMRRELPSRDRVSGHFLALKSGGPLLRGLLQSFPHRHSNGNNFHCNVGNSSQQ